MSSLLRRKYLREKLQKWTAGYASKSSAKQLLDEGERHGEDAERMFTGAKENRASLETTRAFEEFDGMVIGLVDFQPDLQLEFLSLGARALACQTATDGPVRIVRALQRFLEALGEDRMLCDSG